MEWRIADCVAEVGAWLLRVACWIDNRGFDNDMHNHYSVTCHKGGQE
jgi:hypothetical protein